MKQNYRAMQISKPGHLELVERKLPQPGPGEVLIQVEACGICGADSFDIESEQHPLSPPRVPGHEVIGSIIAIGAQVPSIWSLGQRVGVGRFGSYCQSCQPCRQGQFHLCENRTAVGADCDGGYAEAMLVHHTGLVAVPDELNATEAAPLLCAGLATFNALKHCGAKAGDLVAIVGIGGLGHMAVQYAKRMGYKVIAIGRGDDIANDALSLGAHQYIDTQKVDATAKLEQMGGAQAILTTIPHAETIASLSNALRPGGILVLLGVSGDPLPVSFGSLIGGERQIRGSITGTPYDNEKTLAFSVLTEARPMIEVMPFTLANEAYQKMKSGQAKFRMVLSMHEEA